MKREIICPECKEKLRKLFTTDNPYEDEHVKFLRGTALKNYICDNCGNIINENDLCYAFTIWADYSPAPYQEWEHKYININQ